MNRGSHEDARRLLGRPHRFNEAPIHESGKFRNQAQERGRNPGFNEAPIHESGKCP